MKSITICTLHEIFRLIRPWLMISVDHVPHRTGIRNAYKIVVGKSEGKRPHRKHRRGWKDLRDPCGSG